MTKHLLVFKNKDDSYKLFIDHVNNALIKN